MAESQYDEPLPPGLVRIMVKDPRFREGVRLSDVIIGVNYLTGEQVGVFYGIAALERAAGRGEEESLFISEVPLDPDTDDIEIFCALVQTLKGAHCYNAFSRQTQ